MMRRLLVLALILPACAGKGPIYVDEHFTPAEQAEIQAAADFWPAATGGWLNVDLVFGAKVRWGMQDGRLQLVRIAYADTARWFEGNNLGGFTFGGKSDYEVTGIAVERVGSDPVGSGNGGFRTTVIHELGHHFGLHHVDGPGSLMSEGPFAVQLRHVEAQCLTEADADEVCRVAGCAPAPRICEEGQ